MLLYSGFCLHVVLIMMTSYSHWTIFFNISQIFNLCTYKSFEICFQILWPILWWLCNYLKLLIFVVLCQIIFINNNCQVLKAHYWNIPRTSKSGCKSELTHLECRKKGWEESCYVGFKRLEVVLGSKNILEISFLSII